MAVPPKYKVVLFANTDWYLYNFRLSLARALVEAGYDVLLISPPGKYGPRLRALGYRWLPIAMERRSLNPLVEIAVVCRLARLFRREAPALVHGFTIKCAVYGAVAARLAGVAARVSSVAGLGYVFVSRDARARLLRNPLKWILRFALGGRRASLIVQNETDLRFFVDNGLARAECTHLIPGSGVDCTRFTPRAGARRPGPLRVLLASRLLWDKGIGEYARAAEALKTEGRDIEFMLAGDPDPGNPASIPSEIVASWNMAGPLRWLGHVEETAPLYAEVDVVVLPSRYGEGLPRSLIEAAACGKALITTDAPGCRDVVAHEKTGLLIPIEDWSALAAAIARLDDDRRLAHSLGQAARARALECFADPIILRATTELYAKVISAHAEVVRRSSRA
ncbi:MAG TPA: glycosyltransferase family 4 protein [Caulobacteraceae bacterium]